MSGFTDDGTGHNASPGSRGRADKIDQASVEQIVLADLARHGDTVCCTRVDKHGVRVVGGAERTGLGHETYSGTRSRLHDPTHRGNNGTPRVAKLADQHAHQNYYCLPDQVNGRATLPFVPNGGRRIVVTPPSVVDAASRLGAWVRQTENTGLLVMAPDYDDLRIVLAHLL